MRTMNPPDNRQTGPMSFDAMIGLLLSGIAFLIYAGFALMFFSGMFGMGH